MKAKKNKWKMTLKTIKQIEFLNEIEKLLAIRRHCNVSVAKLLHVICKHEGLILRVNKKSFNISRRIWRRDIVI